jgi:hypothetical protein
MAGRFEADAWVTRVDSLLTSEAALPIDDWFTR